MSSIRIVSFVALAGGAIAGAPAHGILIRHDVDDSQYLVEASEYPAVVTVGDAHGTLIAPQWVLTAAHVVDKWTPGTSGGVLVNGREYGVERVILHDQWPGSGMPGIGEAVWVDLALLQLSAPVEDVSPVPILRTTNETGMRTTVVGTGGTGDGRTGVVERDHRLRRAHNVISSVDPDFILMRFDAPPSGEALEGIAGGGDSGGPALVETPEGVRVAGVCSRNSEQGNTKCHYGTSEYYARVSTHAEWMDGVMAPTSTVGALQSIAAAGWPESKISAAAQEFFGALEAGDEAALQAFERTWRGEEESAARAAAWGRTLASGAFVRVESVAVLNSTNLLVRARFENTLRQFRFGFEMGDDSRLRTIEVARLAND